MFFLFLFYNAFIRCHSWTTLNVWSAQEISCLVFLIPSLEHTLRVIVSSVSILIAHIILDFLSLNSLISIFNWWRLIIFFLIYFVFLFFKDSFDLIILVISFRDFMARKIRIEEDSQFTRSDSKNKKSWIYNSWCNILILLIC